MSITNVLMVVFQAFGLIAIASLLFDLVPTPPVSVTVKDQNILRWTVVRLSHKVKFLRDKVLNKKKAAPVVNLAEYRERMQKADKSA